ncbi:MAG: hypothetical protein GWM90_03805, partial [Gemmatimonadetes bacterium]|nr:hypothetical protein [Gemmatimonadota bacterium]NIQ52784.1 hypothetical protein [Gemmatimonadota bacterium]NIU72914.1 hypothetical protein [Gammaproteobacteria bacterium]NIX43274.1 hypothetical protein [Gemmatimonadota bacterium]NIY07451.1 hypothetical protein [Gemmatimonadota bacterium]
MIRIRARRVAFAALATALAVPASARSQDALPSAEDVIDRYVESIGGRDRVLSREGSRSTGTFSMPAAGIEGTVEVITGSSPTRVLSRFEIPGLGTILNGYTGEVGWSMDPNLGPRLLEGKELAAVVEGSSRHASVRDASLFDARETVEETEMNGESCYKVRLLWKSGRETFDCYSKESGLLVASIATQESPMGEIEGVTLMSEYRD